MGLLSVSSQQDESDWVFKTVLTASILLLEKLFNYSNTATEERKWDLELKVLHQGAKSAIR
jgi:hypothetical protein